MLNIPCILDWVHRSFTSRYIEERLDTSGLVDYIAVCVSSPAYYSRRGGNTLQGEEQLP